MAVSAFATAGKVIMEWIELLKALSDQQTSEVTQQQIEVLQGQIVELAELLRFQSLALGILLIIILAFDFYFHFWYKTSMDKKIKKLEDKIFETRAFAVDSHNALVDTISEIDSIKNKNGLLVEK